MSKRLIATFSIVILLFSLLTEQSQAATKAGTSCSKVGKTSISLGKKFTCIRSGQKLIWDTGKIINSGKPSPIPTNSKLIEPDWVVKTKEISLSSRNGSEVHNINTIFISENFDKQLQVGLMEYQNIASHYWSINGVVIPGNLDIVFLTEKDKIWFKNIIGINAPVVDTFFSKQDADIYFNGTVIVDKIPASRFVIVYFVGTNFKNSVRYKSVNSNWNSALANASTHEFQHLVQYTRTLVKSGINLQSQLPCWFSEGFAAFFEDSFYLQTTDKQNFILQNTPENIAELISVRKKRISTVIYLTSSYISERNSVDQWINFLFSNYTQNDVCSSTGYGYTLGRFLVEKLYIDFGTSNILKLLDETNKSNSFSTGFKNAFNVDEKVWLGEKAIPYFLNEAKSLNYGN